MQTIIQGDKTMKLIELQNILGERINIAQNKSENEEQRKVDCQDSELIARLAKQMINNADVLLRAEKINAEVGISKEFKRIIGNG